MYDARLGTFDDRNEACIAVKHWLHRHGAHEYTPGNMRRLAREIVRGDSDPVDTVDATWRETSYGIVRGIVEFAAEEVEQTIGPIEGAAPHAGAHDVAECLRKAVSWLPTDPGRAATRLHDAVAAYERLQSRATREGGPAHERPMTALHLALKLLPGPATRRAASATAA